MIKSVTTLACIFFINVAITAQQAVGINTNNPHPSSVLDIVSTDKGLLIPRLDSVSRMAIVSPANGLMVYDSSYNAFYYFDGNTWSKVGNSDNLGNHTATQNLNLGNNYISGDGTDNGLKIDANGEAVLNGESQNKLTLGDGSSSVSLLGLKNNAQEWRWALGQTSGNVVTLTDVTHDNTPFRIYPSTSTSLTIRGSNIGINNANPSEKLDVAGKTKTINFQMTNSVANGYVMQSDVSGNASWVNPLSIKADTTSLIADTDGNTKVETEQSANENIIRFTLNDTAFFSMNRGVLEFANPGNSVYIGNNSGSNDSYSFSTTNNVGIGNNTLSSLNGNSLATIRNTAIGTNALQNLNSNNGNAIANTALGYSALNNFTGSGSSNVAIGQQAGINKVTGSNNVFLGSTSGANNTNGSGNVFLGNASGFNETGSNKLYIENSNTSTPLIYGDFSTNKVTINDSLQSKYFTMTNGANNGFLLQSNAAGNANWVDPTSLLVTENDPQVSTSTTNHIPKWGGSTLVDGTIYDNGNIGIGTSTPADQLHIVGNARIDAGRINFYNSGNSVFVGKDAGLNDNLTANKNVFIGEDAGKSNISGTLNVFVGHESGTNNNTGFYNTSIGQATLKQNTSGFNNTAIGRAALLGNKTGEFNIGIGSGALLNDSSGVNNSIVGTNGFYNSLSGSYNTSLGNYAGYNNINGFANVFIGYNAGYNETGSNKLFIDNSSTSSPLIWGDFSNNYLNFNANVGIGTNTPTEKLEVIGKAKSTNFQMTNGANSAYVLQSDANGNATWVDPTTLAITETDPQVSSSISNNIPKWNGTTLADGTITDNGNIGIGTGSPSDKLHIVGNAKIDSGRINFTNTGNSIFIGNDAGLNDDLSENQNVFVGENAGKTNTTGTLNVFVGHESGLDNNTGLHNTAIGQASLHENTTGSFNTAVGRASLLNNTKGHRNVGVGIGTLFSDTTGGYNTIVGTFGFYNNVSGSFNTSLGNHTGHNNISGTGNVFLGNEAGYNELGSDKLYIDNSDTASPLIWGDFSNNFLNFNANVGIGTNNPTEKLEVLGNTKSINLQMTHGATNGYVLQGDEDGNAFWVNPSTLTNGNWTTSDTNQYSALSGNVGVGTSFPSEKLEVIGKTKTTNFQMTNGAMDGYVFQSDSSGNGSWADISSTIQAGTGLTYSGNTLNSKWTTSSSDIYSNNTGKVGIGTSNPQSKLANTSNNILGANGQGTNSNSITWSMNNTGYIAAFYNSHNGSNAQGLAIKTSGNTSANRILDLSTGNTDNTAGTSVMVVQGDGNVGIGTELPSNKLHLVGNQTIESGKINFTNTANSIYLGNGAGNSDDLSGNTRSVGIGALALLNNTGAGNTGIGYINMSNNSTGASNTSIGFGTLNGNTTGSWNVAIGQQANFLNTTGSYNVAVGGVALQNGDGSNNTAIGYKAGEQSTGSNNVFIGYKAGGIETGSNKLYIDNSDTSSPLIWGDFANNNLNFNANVGIGNSSPTSTLAVSGSVATKFKTPLVAGTTNPDNTGMTWRYTSGTGTITLPAASTCTDRIYIIINQTGSTRTLSQYRDLVTVPQTTLGSSQALWIQSDGNEWWQIK